MPIECMEFLFSKREAKPPALLVVFGGDPFLTAQVRPKLREWVIGAEPDDFTYSAYSGDSAKLADVMDDLFTPPFLGDVRLVEVREADKFITEHRATLEDFAQSPSETGVLLLETKLWNKTTKLAKAAESSGLTIDAKPLEKPKQVESWCVQWARRQYGKKLATPTAGMLVDMVGTNLGQLDQELCKIAAYVGDSAEIDVNAVQKLTAGTHSEETFKLLGFALEGRLSHAIDQLDRMIVNGTAPQMIMGTLITQLRKLTKAARLVVGGRPMKAALEDAGFRHPFAVRMAEQQLRYIGRARMAEMYRRMLKADLGLKGGTELSMQTVIERFLVELAERPSPAHRPQPAPGNR